MEKDCKSSTSPAAYPTFDIQQETYEFTSSITCHLTPESHIKSREGEDPCSCGQKLLCRKAPICLACSMERQK